MKLLGRHSSMNVRKVLWLAEELGLALESEEWGGDIRSTRTPEFLALNPNGLVPVLVDGDEVLWESNTICRYLTARTGREDLLPASPAARAHVEQWMDWQAGELNNSWRYVFMARVRQSPAHQDPAAIAAGIDGWAKHMRILEEQLGKTGGYVAGPHFALADIVIGLSTNRWMLTPMERPDLPLVAAYYRALGERPGFRRFGPGLGA
ncbi:glutathione S-transferase family protein [Radicibacter daui]|uniref:glutathione S-transferase family protein n=1 Tax=Radicibacter daui TaxID=3064829 RepID=UPI004046C080